jgi:hypothetical protein
MLSTAPWNIADIEAALNAAGHSGDVSGTRVPPCPPRILNHLRHEIHRWHRREGGGGAAPEVHNYLAARRGTLTCPHCEATF